MSDNQPLENTQPLQANANAGLIEQRGHSMLLDYKRGVPFDKIAALYGCLPSEVEMLVAKAQEDAILRNEHLQFKAEAMNELTILARELAEMDSNTPLLEEFIEETLGNDNKAHPIKRAISHVQTKLRIKTERRNNVMSRIAISGTKTGEGGSAPQDSQDSDLKQIKDTLVGVASAITHEFFGPLVQQAAAANQEIGRLQVERVNTIDITQECRVNDVLKQNEEQGCENSEGVNMNCQSCGSNESVIDLTNPNNIQYMSLAAPEEKAICRPCLDRRKASLSGGGLNQAPDFNLAEMR